MDSLQTISSDLVESINEKEKKKSIPYDTYAKVIRIDGGTAWVHIPGGVDETPVALTVNAKVGDSVLVRVSGGNAWIVGNSSAPPTDDTKAVEAKGVADVAQVKAENAQETAENAEATAASARARASSALEIAEGTNEHFWHDNTGAHITQITQEEWQDTPAGGNTLITSEGMAIRDGMASLAVFEDDGIRIGQNDQARAEVTPYTFEAVDKEGDTFFSVEDLRDETGGVHTVTDTFISDGTTTNLNLTYRATNTSYTVTVDGGAPPASMTKTQTQIVFGLVPTEGAVIIATYQTASQYAKAYTLGIRAANSAKGGMSTAEGQDCVASGRYSHAEGHECTSSGAASHAEGISTNALYDACHAEGANTEANDHGSHAEGLNSSALGYASHAQNFYTEVNHAFQTAIGKYNDNKSNNAFEVGNGGDGENRHNALEVSWSGDVYADGDVQDGSGNILADKADRSEIPTKTSELNNDSGFITGITAERVSIADNISIPGSGTSWADGTRSVAKTGYTPLGVVGYRVVNASTSGTGGANAAITHAYIDGSTAYYRVKNVSTSAIKVRVYFNILYLKN